MILAALPNLRLSAEKMMDSICKDRKALDDARTKADEQNRRKDLFGLLEAEAACTPASGERFRVWLEISDDRAT